MSRQSTIFTRTYTLFPYLTLFRSRGGDNHPRDEGVSDELSCFHHNPTIRNSRKLPEGPTRIRSAPSRLGARRRVPNLRPRSPLWVRLRSTAGRSEEHTSELQSLMRISYAVFCLKKKIYTTTKN